MDSCIGDIYKSFDEIILIDYGADNFSRKDLAEKYNCQIFDYEWNNDFSKIKNYALANASGEWILFLELFEQFSEKNLKDLFKYLDNPKLSGIGINILSYDEQENLIGIRTEYRVFRNIPQIEFVNPVFENVKESLEKYSENNQMILLEESDLFLKSYESINIPLLKDLLNSALKKSLRPIDLILFNFKKSELELFEGHKHSSVLSLLETYDLIQKMDLNFVSKNNFIADIYFRILQEMEFSKNYQTGRDFSFEMIKHFNLDYRGYFYAGKFLYLLQDFENSQKLFREAITILEYNYSFRFGKPEYAKKHLAEIESMLPNKGENKKISFFVITKNEEEYLEQCLNSIKDLVDEIIVLDTGSTDKTIQIAEQFTDKIFNTEWLDDFSQARNEAISYCQHPWIFTLDADEFLAEVPLDYFRSLTANEQIIAYTVARDDVDETDNSAETAYYYRFFQNNQQLKYEFPIFETLAYSISELLLKENFNTRKSELLIKHVGYKGKSKKKDGRNLRNKRIILKTLQKNDLKIKEQILFTTKLARIEAAQDLEKSLDLFLKALDLTEGIPEKEKFDLPIIIQIYEGLSELYKHKNDFPKALYYVQLGLSIFANSPTLNYKQALILYLMGEYAKSIDSFLACINLGISGAFYELIAFDRGIFSYRSLSGIGLCYLKIADYDSAKKFLLECLKVKPDYQPAINALEAINQLFLSNQQS